jgi:Protein ENHANCED DISEASE RESISTANCE 2, C-terminal/PH domain
MAEQQQQQQQIAQRFVVDIDRIRTNSGESFTSTGSSTTKVVGSIVGCRSVSGTMEDLQATGSFEHESGGGESSTMMTMTTIAKTNSRDRDGDVMDNDSEASSMMMDEEIRMATAMALAIQNNPNLTPDEIHELLGQQTPAPIAPYSSPSMTTTTAAAAAKKPASMSGAGGGGQFRGLANMFSTTNMMMDDVHSSSSHNHRTISMAASNTPRLVQGLADRARGRLQDIMMLHNNNNATTTSTSNTTTTAAAKDSTTMMTTTTTSTGTNSHHHHLSDDHNSNDNHSGSAAALHRTILGTAWKRRGGLAKFTTTSCWERRYFCLLGPVQNHLVYYAEEPPQSSDHNNNVSAAAVEPRGTIDLTQHSITVAAGHSGAPTPYAISIKNSHGETKWKICCDSHQMQITWLLSLSSCTIRHSVDSSNTNLIKAAAAASLLSDMTDLSSSVLDYTMYYPPGETGGVASTKKTSSLWSLDAAVTNDDPKRDAAAEMSTTTNTASTTTDDTTATTTTVATTTTTIWTEADHAAARAEIVAAAPRYPIIDNVPMVYLFWNIGAIVARAISPTDLFWYILIGGNVFIYRCLIEMAVDWQSLTPHIYKAPVVKPTATTAAAVASNSSGIDHHGQSSSSSSSAVDPTVTGAVAGRFIPVAGSSSIQLQNTDDVPVNAQGQHFAGWRKVSGELLKVRAHGYETTKEKVSSPGELYDCVAVDVFESPQRYPDMAPRVQLPTVEYDDDDDDDDEPPGTVKTWRAPDIFIVSIALPTDPPKMGKSSSDGGGYTVTMYYKLKASTRALLRKVTAGGYDGSSPEDQNDPRVNAVRLWEEWIRRAPSDPKFMARFKVVPLAHNLAEIGMPGWIAKYNGKPFLIKRAGVTGFIHTHPQLSCVEFDISLHPFPYLAKQGICFMKDSYFKRVLVTFGFVIEGRTDDELPETVIGCMQLCYPDPQYAIQAKDFFNGTAPRSIDTNTSTTDIDTTKKSTDTAVEDTTDS